MICPSCQNIFRGEMHFIGYTSDDLLGGKLQPHHVTRESLLGAVEEHCQICTEIWRTIQQTNTPRELGSPWDTCFTSFGLVLGIFLEASEQEQFALLIFLGLEKITEFYVEPFKGLFELHLLMD